MRTVRLISLLLLCIGAPGCTFELGEPLDFNDCDSDADCDDGVFCNGQERCVSGILGRVCQDASFDEPRCGQLVPESCNEPLAMCVPCEDAPGAPGCELFDGGVDAGPEMCGSSFCGVGETCVASRCERSCILGRDRPHVGLEGRGDGCEVGEACYWTGDPDSLSAGYCAPGNYNDVRVPNLGASCGGDTECYSPFGRGRCEEGVCVVDDCLGLAQLAPGVTLTAPLCPSPAVCGDDQVCRAPCASAADCAETEACGGHPVQCRATCEADEECRPTESCLDGEGAACAEGAVCACVVP